MYTRSQKIESQIILKSSGARKQTGKQCIHLLHKYTIFYCSFKLSHNDTFIAHIVIIQFLLNFLFYYKFFQGDIIFHDPITIDNILFLGIWMYSMKILIHILRLQYGNSPFNRIYPLQ